MIHLHFHNIAILQELVCKIPDPARSTRQDDRALSQRRAPREVGDDLPHRPDHIMSARLLLKLAVHSRREVQRLWVWHNTRRRYSGPDRRKPIERFRIAILPPTDVAGALKAPRGDVVADGIPEHEVEGGVFGGVFAVFADDYRHFAFPIHLRLHVGVHADVVGGPC